MREEEKATLETQSLPLRNYLMKFVMPTLTEGLVEVCKVKPDDPVDYLVRRGCTQGWACVTPALQPLASLGDSSWSLLYIHNVEAACSYPLHVHNRR